MKSPDRPRLAIAVSMLLLSALACNLPGTTAPTPFVFPTLDLTQTSVFQTAQPAASATLTPVLGAAATATLPSPATIPPSPTLPLAATFTPTYLPPTAIRVPPTAVPPTRKQVSYAGPGERLGTSVEAVYLDREPALDGVFDDWDLDRYTANRLTYGGDQWGGEADLSAQFMLGWDEDNLYIAARVFDDEYVQNASGDEIFEGDSIEILLDTDVSADYYLEALNSDDYQLGLTAGSPAPGSDLEAFLWFPEALSGTPRRVRAGASPSDNGYRIEAAIPWSVFDTSPRTGRHYGFVFSVSDNDRSNRNVQQSMVSNVSGRVLTDPTTWGDLVLSGRRDSSSRPGEKVQSVYLDRTPRIDGDLGDWNQPAVDVDSLVYGAEHYSGELDLSGRLMVGWDEDYLYLAARVYDNEYVQNARGENLYLGDSVELLLDADLAGDFGQHALSGDDFQIGLSPGTVLGAKGLEAFLWYPDSYSGPLAKVVVAAQATGDGYTLEAAIPWFTFGVQPREGARYGFAFSISDNDNAAHDVQQSLVSNVSTRILTDPTSWGELILSD